MFPSETKIKANWYTGLLLIRTGAKKSDKYVILEIDNGKITKERSLNRKDLSKFKNKQFKAFKETDDYKQLMEKLKQEGPSASVKYLNSYLNHNIISVSNKILMADN